MEFFYNKDGSVRKFVEYHNSGILKSKYILKNNRILTRTINDLNIDGFKKVKNLKTKNTMQKAKILYDEDVKIFHITEDGESHIIILKKDSISEYPKVKNKIYCTDDLIENYNIKKELMNNWKNKLQTA